METFCISDDYPFSDSDSFFKMKMKKKEKLSFEPLAPCGDSGFIEKKK
jgi:hypothetical protein